MTCGRRWRSWGPVAHHPWRDRNPAARPPEQPPTRRSSPLEGSQHLSTWAKVNDTKSLITPGGIATSSAKMIRRGSFLCRSSSLEGSQPDQHPDHTTWSAGRSSPLEGSQLEPAELQRERQPVAHHPWRDHSLDGAPLSSLRMLSLPDAGPAATHGTAVAAHAKVFLDVMVDQVEAVPHSRRLRWDREHPRSTPDPRWTVSSRQRLSPRRSARLLGGLNSHGRPVLQTFNPRVLGSNPRRPTALNRINRHSSIIRGTSICGFCLI
jgi:hypothetical protein